MLRTRPNNEHSNKSILKTQKDPKETVGNFLHLKMISIIKPYSWMDLYLFIYFQSNNKLSVSISCSRKYKNKVTHIER